MLPLLPDKSVFPASKSSDAISSSIYFDLLDVMEMSSFHWLSLLSRHKKQLNCEMNTIFMATELKKQGS